MSVKINFNTGVVDMAIGAGGKAMNRLIDQLMKKAFANDYLLQGEDQATLPEIKGQLAMTTDNYVITPYFFPGGDIGSLAVYGTVNDLVVGGAKPLYLSVGFILEEGLPLKDLKEIVNSMAEAAKKVGVKLVTGDTKVVEKGKGDGIFINTTGLGVIEQSFVTRTPLQKGDNIIINGFIAEHGVAVMSKRQGLNFDCNVKSDVMPLNRLIDMLYQSGCKVKTMRDPTRGGVGATLNEWAYQYQVGICINESALPVGEEVRSACELLGLDPLFIANEGKVLIVCEAQETDKILQGLQSQPEGKDAAVIAKIESENEAYVTMKTRFGGIRRVDWLSGEQLPRIC
ncbi:hydrogenase expression/formation protein HypE [Fastidiosibacter lacustris]|uniref:hydrogenase expression/formation protein HypE n=1 Tax=Fastidiosibacter lacustris TaxID=2056695 RepID=UPI000E34E7D7|nr:hydrogenase expression/formation protein HypE [Fastidiosibacter lacustris]